MCGELLQINLSEWDSCVTKKGKGGAGQRKISAAKRYERENTVLKGKFTSSPKTV